MNRRLQVGMLLVSSSCVSSGERNAAVANTLAARTADEIAVQSAAVDSIAASSHAAVVLVVATMASWFGDTLSDRMQSVLWADFARHAIAGGQLGSLVTRTPFQVVGKDWSLRGTVTDTALIAVSAVGFSPLRDEAMIYVDHSCGSRCGSTVIETFRRHGSAWVITEKAVQSRR